MFIGGSGGSVQWSSCTNGARKRPEAPGSARRSPEAPGEFWRTVGGGPARRRPETPGGARRRPEAPGDFLLYSGLGLAQSRLEPPGSVRAAQSLPGNFGLHFLCHLKLCFEIPSSFFIHSVPELCVTLPQKTSRQLSDTSYYSWEDAIYTFSLFSFPFWDPTNGRPVAPGGARRRPEEPGGARRHPERKTGE